MPQMHSKQPQEVIGSSRMEYSVTVSTAPWVASATASLTVVVRGRCARRVQPVLRNGLAGAGGVELVGRLGVQPRDRAAQAQTLRA